MNTGDRNTGYWNTGNWNTGDRNTGNWNTGDRNTGNWNTGDRNTGYWNTGDWNTGDWNTGDRNTGNWNTGDRNTGYCNSITPEDCLIFNKPAKRQEWFDADKPDWMRVNLTKWIGEINMTDSEKEAYPDYVTTGGYLKHYSSLQQAYIEAWEKATPEDRAKTEKLPNFDPTVFEEVFGFNPFKKRSIIIDGKKIELSEESFNELKKSLEV
jgi:hypothetical protein